MKRNQRLKSRPAGLRPAIHRRGPYREYSSPRRRTAGAQRLLATTSVAGILLLSGCNDMWQQPKYTPLAPSRFFDDNTSARPLLPGVVAREDPRTLTTLDTGKSGERLAAKMPLRVTMGVLRRGKERYEINCAPCHGLDGAGRGMIVWRGFPSPPSYHSERLRRAPDGHFFDVITNGYGAMYSYADRVQPADRWAITAYIRALQRSQNATLADVPPAERAKLEATP